MISFKTKRDREMFGLLHPILIMIFADVYSYAKERHNIELVVTQTVSNKFIDQKLKRKSPAHSQHRAIDIRTKDLDAFVIKDILLYVNNHIEFSKYRYMSQSGKQRLAYYHVGSAEHIHLAIHSRFAL
ncbi:MAG: hypothetical protein ACI9IA_000216 [Enterobacterales bacterium]|jgi:hypothetical protein